MDVTLAIPPQTDLSAVEIEVTMEGRRTVETYRVITVACEKSPDSSCAGELRRAVLSIEPGWQLVSIGTPSDSGIPLLFRRRTISNGTTVQSN
jgi:hypothetical protein